MNFGRRLKLRLGSAATGSWPLLSSEELGIRCSSWLQQKLMMVTKAPDRSAVHGTRPPVTRTINIEEVEEEINAGKEKKENKIEEIQNRIHGNDKNTADVGGSSSDSSSSSSTN